MENKWISVKERLPEIGSVVLTYWNFGKNQVLFYCGDNGKSWFGTNGKINSLYHETELFECITHWMPLPEPPK